MTPFDPFAALALPSDALIDRRVPKILLIENGTYTAANRRRIQEGIEKLRWLAAIKPTTVDVAEYRDAAREYLEITILKLTLRLMTHTDRLVELIHRAVPYPVLSVAWQRNVPELSQAHKRWSRGEAGKTKTDGEIVAAQIGSDCTNRLTVGFREALALARRSIRTLYALYGGWIDAVQALCAARIIEVFSLPASTTKALNRTAALEEFWCLDDRIVRLGTAIEREKQISCRVEMNVELAHLRTNRNAARVKL